MPNTKVFLAIMKNLKFYIMAKIFKVSEINKYTRNLLKDDIILRSEIIVSGEISDLTVNAKSGHAYFTLKEGGCQIRAAFFVQYRKKSNLELKEGMQIDASGKIDLYEISGQYQLIVSSVKESGLGELYEKFIKLKEKLEQEGLFAQEAKRDIPFYPRNIAIITSETGAVIKDIVTTANNRCDNINLLLFSAIVQGEQAPDSIMHALKQAQQIGDIDVIILARGGGSFEDLNCFNDEMLARQIYECTIPIISAVGHDTDYTIADYVADVRAATPTAAAVIAVPDKNDLIRQLGELKYRLDTPVTSRINTAKLYLKSVLEKLKGLHPRHSLQMREQQLDRLYEQIQQKMERLMQLKKEKLSIMKTKLIERNPSLPLEKGYAWLYTEGNKVIKDIAEISIGTQIGLAVKGGTAEATVNSISTNH